MATDVLLPKLGLTMEEGTIVEWVARPGDQVRSGDVLLRLGTDKVDVDVEAEAEGRFQPIVEEGATLPPGAVIAYLLGVGEEAPASAPAVTAPAADPAAPVGPPRQSAAPDSGRLLASPNAKRVARELGIDLAAVPGTGPGGRIVSEDVEELAARPPAAVTSPPAPAAAPDGAPALASPLVRRYAAAQGVRLDQVRGSGIGGRVRRADVDAAAAVAPATIVTPAVPAARRVSGTVIPLTGMRGAIAKNMLASLQEMAQLTHGVEAEVGALLALREQLKAQWGPAGLRVPTINDFVVKAVGLALGEHPVLNATVRDGGIHLLEEISVGIAVALPDGLVVPVVRDTDAKPLVDIAQETRDLAETARAGTLQLSQIEGATFVVSSLGSYGVDFFTPVVNPGNTGILGVGRVKDGVRWEGDRPVRTSVLTLSLSFDHRAVDGAPAAEFLATVSGLLATPLLLLAG